MIPAKVVEPPAPVIRLLPVSSTTLLVADALASVPIISVTLGSRIRVPGRTRYLFNDCAAQRDRGSIGDLIRVLVHDGAAVVDLEVAVDGPEPGPPGSSRFRVPSFTVVRPL